MARYPNNSQAFFAGAGEGLSQSIPGAMQMYLKSKEGDKDFARQQAATMALHKMIADQAEQSRLATQQGSSWDRTVQEGYDTGTNTAGESAVLNQLGPQGASQLQQEGNTAMPGTGVPLAPDAIDTLKVLQRQSHNPTHAPRPVGGGSVKEKDPIADAKKILSLLPRNFLGITGNLTPEGEKHAYGLMLSKGYKDEAKTLKSVRDAAALHNTPLNVAP